LQLGRNRPQGYPIAHGGRSGKPLSWPPCRRRIARHAMCLILFAIEAHPDLSLVIASNRDEAHDRPTAPLGPWPDQPALLAGRDLVAGGTWLGIHADGRWAAVTNHRRGDAPAPRPRSRGHLVRDYLAGPSPLTGV